MIPRFIVRQNRTRRLLRRTRRSGQSIIESGLVIMLMSMIFFGLFQVSQVFMAKEVLDNAASAGARAKAVGFNDFMIWKVVRVATIPNAGIMTTPGYDTVASLPRWQGTDNTVSDVWNAALDSNPSSGQYVIEESRIPMYLGSMTWTELPGYLDYEEWDSVNDPSVSVSANQMARVRVSQDFPLKFPLHRAFYADDGIDMSSSARAGHYAETYLE